MSENSLENFFREKKQAAGPSIDWEMRKREWIDAVNALYKTITEEYLAHAIKDGVVSASYTTKTVHENLIGTYQIPELTLQVNDEKVLFSPKGRNVVGGSGRIDLIGPTGERTLILQPGRWMIVFSRTPTLKLIPFDPDSLLQTLKDVMAK